MLIQKYRLQITTLLVFASMGTAAMAADTSTPDAKTNADTSSGTPKVTATTKLPNPAPSESVDDMITNNNLRALSGSTSRWSIASQFNYNGGTISSPASQDRPNISDASGNTVKSDLDGSINVKYNLNAKHALLAGFGIRWIAPTAPGGPSNYPGSTFDAINPTVTYQYVYKWFGIQSVLQVQGMQWTQADYTALGYGQQLSVDQENMFEVPKTNLSFGASTAIAYQWFNKSGSYGSPSDPDNYVPNVATQQSQYSFTIAPIVEYQLSEKVNLRTLVSLWNFEHYVSYPHTFAFKHDTIYQSVGVGVSVTRDFFLYPNVQFLPGQLSASMTNVGIGATVNLF